jgi:hypothetical protein
MGRRLGSARISPEQVVDIFTAPGRYKLIARAFGVTEAYVSLIKTGRYHAEITKPYIEATRLNASLISATFGVHQ